MLDRLKTAGIPMRMKAAQKPSDILHWKMMLFAGQDVVEFSAANYTPYSFVPAIPYVNYIDEAVFFSDNPSLTNTFRTRYDNLWTDTTGSIVNYANISSTPQRVYGIFPQDPSLNFPPTQDFAVRAVARYARETVGIDVIMFRVPDSRHADAMISAKARGVAVRLIMEQDNYRDRRFLWHAYNVDRMYAAGIPVKDRKHLGLTHQKSVVLRGLGEVIFGSSNWSPEAADVEQEHNLFTSQVCRAGLWCDAGGWVWRWFRDQFVSKWNSATEYKPFVPSGPDSPAYVSPANGNTGVSTGAALTWQGGSWAHLYDVYLGTDPNNLPLVARDARLGSPEAGRLEAFRPATLAGSTMYDWRVVSRTMARLSRTGTTWRFTTGTGGLTLLRRSERPHGDGQLGDPDRAALERCFRGDALPRRTQHHLGFRIFADCHSVGERDHPHGPRAHGRPDVLLSRPRGHNERRVTLQHSGVCNASGVRHRHHRAPRSESCRSRRRMDAGPRRNSSGRLQGSRSGRRPCHGHRARPEPVQLFRAQVLRAGRQTLSAVDARTGGCERLAERLRMGAVHELGRRLGQGRVAHRFGVGHRPER